MVIGPGDCVGTAERVGVTVSDAFGMGDDGKVGEDVWVSVSAGSGVSDGVSMGANVSVRKTAVDVSTGRGEEDGVALTSTGMQALVSRDSTTRRTKFAVFMSLLYITLLFIASLAFAVCTYGIRV